jgi:hypothetical protein
MNRAVFTILVFFLGFFSSLAILAIMPSEAVADFVLDGSRSLVSPISGTAPDGISPGKWINTDQIEFHKDKVIIHIDDPRWAVFADTKSMLPVLDSETNAIQVVPTSPSQIREGDIVSYYSEIARANIVHRVIETGYDEEGWYAIMKGDNLRRQDPEKVRFSNVRRVVVALVY